MEVIKEKRKTFFRSNNGRRYLELLLFFNKNNFISTKYFLQYVLKTTFNTTILHKRKKKGTKQVI